MTNDTIQPAVTSVVNLDGTATVVVDDLSYEITAPGPAVARSQVTAYIASAVATPSGGPILVHAMDCGTPDTLLVFPDGTIADAGAAAPNRHGVDEAADVMRDRPPAAPAAPAAAPSPPALAVPGLDAPAAAAPTAAPPPPAPPTLDDFLASRPAARPGPAQSGWRGVLARVTRGLIAPPPSAAELAQRGAVQAVQESFDGPKTIVVINTKGGGGKTTATYCLAATFGIYRGGYVLAWDNNETRGSLAWRSARARHGSTAVTLLRDLDRFADPGSARIGDLDNYVRGQGGAQFDVLASDEDAASAASIDAAAFNAVHRTLSRFYRIMVVDTGNNIKASNWQAAVDAADQVVIVSSIREDTAGGAAWTLDSLIEAGHDEKVKDAVTVLSAPSTSVDDALAARLTDHFSRRTRAVLRVPFDPALVDGGPIDVERLSPRTREAWLQVAATIADHL
jgi:MinD-like ATPase involved in chromosome partitioning or flagellar assembly